MRLAHAGVFGVVLCASFVFPSCSEKTDKAPFDGYDPGSTFVPTSPSTPGTPSQPGSCREVKAELLAARREVTAAGAPGSGGGNNTRSITKQELWTDFEKSCGQAGCHGVAVGAAPRPDLKSGVTGTFTINLETFTQRADLGSLSHARILSADRDKVMPPGSGDGSRRAANEPLRLLAERMLAWEEQQFPDVFQVQTNEPLAGGSPAPSSAPYRLPATMAAGLTNIGSCLPTQKLEIVQDEAKALDARFASMTSFADLPDTLVETDLATLDSAELARRGVFSYAPTYTLFSDNASKMRYVRVPVGQKIRYNPETKDFFIPPNTRFYKTFLRKVIDKNGEVGYRKMETRLIVSRPDELLPDGRYAVRSLMVIYAWDKDEQMARKIIDPLESGDPWADRLCPYVTDERAPRDPDKNPVSPESNRDTCTYMTSDELANAASGKIRHYPLPSRERCVECHMGSQNHSFILGFTPWHVDRRSADDEMSGVFEPPFADELEQLQRLIEWGVIEGIAPGEAKLEESQGTRKPRNKYEAVAQGYMMGNCAFCHNPTGFPTVQNPVLKDFDLFPSATGGVFQFPLEKYSPRAKVGPLQTLRHPYITPAIGDFELTDGFTGSETEKPNTKTLRELTSRELFPTLDYLPPVGPRSNNPGQNLDELDPVEGIFKFYGPWRSLIWRNVYTPFTYEEDNTLFIHMPRNVPGYDCRAQTIMAEWMLSIPSIPKLKKLAVNDPVTNTILVPGHEQYKKGATGFEQPYQEVKEGEFPYENVVAGDGNKLPDRDGRAYGYQNAVTEAELRLQRFRNSLTGSHCPDDDDTVDPGVAKGERKAPIDEGRLNGARVNVAAQGTLRDAVPDRAHWVVVDTTDRKDVWKPRRSQWKDILVDRSPSVPVSPEVSTVVDMLQGLFLDSEQERFATESLPMGFWAPECSESQEASTSSKRLSAWQAELASSSPSPGYQWLVAKEGPRFALRDGARRVHQQSRGEAVFRATCQNCHGRDIDSRSPLAATILELTGGGVRVANFLDGMLGPVAAPGQFAHTEFQGAKGGGTPADWLARYMVFMGMGGTLSAIPPIAVRLVSTSPFYGSAPKAGDNVKDANMLESARALCRSVLDLPWEVKFFRNPATAATGMYLDARSIVPFVENSGHLELWASLCGFRNTPTVRVFTEAFPSPAATENAADLFREPTGSVYLAKSPEGEWLYPQNHPVGTLDGRVEKGINANNLFAWCVAPKSEEDRQRAVSHFRLAGVDDEKDMPFCPSPVLARAFGNKGVHQLWPRSSALVPRLLDDWTRRGAMNAGVAAYYFLDGMTKKKLQPKIGFDECKR
ncbi:MAG: hypothetical protein KA712_03685 [Myxococcales bacterium]|nr:hypothetical protein [Myxococcales bacterium]